MFLKEIETIKRLAYHILQDKSDPVVRFRILRDLLKESSDSDSLIRAQQNMLRSRWVLKLKQGQGEDGGWCRFHSAVKVKGSIKTTEAAVERGLALGLQATDPIFQATVGYLSRLLEGKIAFPDPPERNNRWATGKQLFVAATLARLCPTLSVLDRTWGLWADIATRTFASGRYDPDAEICAHRLLTGASVKDSYLVLSGRYQLALLGSRATKLPKEFENALVDWVWHKKDGIGYLEVPLYSPPHCFTPGMVDRWFTSLDLISCFPSWRKFAKNTVDWLWTRRNEDGFWDFGPRASMSVYFPLSENWRSKEKRQHDWSIRVLALLRNYFDHSGESVS